MGWVGFNSYNQTFWCRKGLEPPAMVIVRSEEVRFAPPKLHQPGRGQCVIMPMISTTWPALATMLRERPWPMRKEMALLHEIDAGNLDHLQCPNCNHNAVSAWFTRPQPETFRTWLICADCHFYTHVINAGMPPFFSEDRVRMDLQEKDAAILKSMRFKWPPAKD